MNGARSCDSYPFAAIGSDSQPSGGVRGRSGAKAKKAKGFLRKPNNPRLYDNVSLTNDNVCRNPQNVSRKRKMFAFIPFMLADSEKMQTELL